MRRLLRRRLVSFRLAFRLIHLLRVRVFLRSVLAVRIVSIVAGYPSITAVKHNTFVQLPLFFHRKGSISALGTTVPFDSTGEADHCVALRLIPACALWILLWILVLMSRRTLVLRVSISSVIRRRLRRIAGLRRWQRASLFAVELIRGLWLAMMLTWRVLLRRISLRRISLLGL